MCHPVDDSVTYNDHLEQQLEMPGSGRTIPTYTYGYKPQEHTPAVIVAHDIFGASPFYRDLARRLAQAGFAAFVPDLFSREGAISSRSMEAAMERSSRHSVPTSIADVQAIADKLSSEGRKVGVIGFCMGGTLAFFAASRVPSVQANVVYYGFPVNAHPSKNKPDSPIDEVAQLHAPILGFFGAHDTNVGPKNVKAYEAVAQKAGKAIGFTI